MGVNGASWLVLGSEHADSGEFRRGIPISCMNRRGANLLTKYHSVSAVPEQLIGVGCCLDRHPVDVNKLLH